METHEDNSSGVKTEAIEVAKRDTGSSTRRKANSANNKTCRKKAKIPEHETENNDKLIVQSSSNYPNLKTTRKSRDRDMKNFNVQEDILLISAYEVYLSNKRKIRLYDLIDELSKVMGRTVKSISKRIERLTKMETSQVKILFDYYEKYKDISAERKVMLCKNGIDIYLCSTNEKCMFLDEKQEFKAIRRHVLKDLVLDSAENNAKRTWGKYLDQNDISSDGGVEECQEISISIQDLDSRCKENDDLEGIESVTSDIQDVKTESNQIDNDEKLNFDETYNDAEKEVDDLDAGVSSPKNSKKRFVETEYELKRVNYLNSHKIGAGVKETPNQKESSVNKLSETAVFESSNQNSKIKQLQNCEIINDKPINNLVVIDNQLLDKHDVGTEDLTARGTNKTKRVKKSILPINIPYMIEEGFVMFKKRHNLNDESNRYTRTTSLTSKRYKKPKLKTDVIDVSISELDAVSMSGRTKEPDEDDFQSKNELGDRFRSEFDFEEEDLERRFTNINLDLDLNDQ